jgi:hypothetical protein
MSARVPEDHPLRGLFREATGWAFRHGLFPDEQSRDARLRSYLSEEILARFLHVDQLYRLRDARGRALADVGDMLTEGQAPGASPELRALGVQRHIGDYTLFIVGIFPESLERVRRDWRRKDAVLMQLGALVVPFRDPREYYQQAGRRAYAQAAEIGQERGMPEADLFQKLSRYFFTYAQIMDLVRMYLDASPLFEERRRIIS